MLSIIPIRAGTKQPAVPWKQYQEEPAPANSTAEWLSQGHDLAVVTGAVSGNLEVLDVDQGDMLLPLLEELKREDFPVAKLSCIVQTRKGWHIYYRAPEIGGNLKLATSEDGQSVIFETRGEGGYVVSPLGPTELYHFKVGNYDQIPRLHSDERDALLGAARKFDQRPAQEVLVPPEYSGGGRPGDAYNSDADWEPILEEVGWELVDRRSDGSSTWRRPGKLEGSISATLNYRGSGLFHVFTSSVPELEPGKSYSKFAFYTAVHHGGDYRAAAAALAQLGYGGKSGSPESLNVLTNLVDLAADWPRFESYEGEGFSIAPGVGLAPIDSPEFAHALAGAYRSAFGKLPSESANRDARAHIARDARVAGRREEVFIRRGFDRLTRTVVIDLAQTPEQYVLIDDRGWRLADTSPVYFKRSAGLLPLPTPTRGGSLDGLGQFVNVAGEEQWLMLKSWLLGSLNPFGALPVLVIQGDPGTGKSTVTKLLRRLIDPTMPELLGYPKSVDAVHQHAIHNFLLTYDNLSGVSNDVSDVFCTLATGGGFATRTLYTTAGRSAFTFKRPVVLNGIDDIANRGDLISRSIGVRFTPIPRGEVRDEASLFYQFDRVHAELLGALYEAVSASLSHWSETDITGLGYRMADFVRWVLAGVSALGVSRDAYLQALDANFTSLHANLMETDLIANFLLQYMSTRKVATHTASGWFEMLAKATPSDTKRSRDFPQSPSTFGRQLNRLRPTLGAVGLQVEQERSSGKRAWKVTRLEAP